MENTEFQRKSHLRETQIQAKAVARILATGDFLPVDELADRFPAQSMLSPSAFEAWEAEERIFSITQESLELYPSYAFSAKGELLPCLRDVLMTLRPYKSSWGMAFWFGSANSFLGCKQPKHLLLLQPELVLAAANVEASSYLYE
ncbi:TPA: hypothetical protein L5C15_006044 [Pseudomonas aeruginosa]|jgi:hypothetical protein|nr:hypothetical protein [Pseudomonas aeruginosa]HBO8188772.1 hypothetical protein [Pseudomonas aeruginosa]HBO8714004.1 hypothetical protein [Pseudomonas aeruginosa]